MYFIPITLWAISLFCLSSNMVSSEKDLLASIEDDPDLLVLPFFGIAILNVTLNESTPIEPADELDTTRLSLLAPIQSIITIKDKIIPQPLPESIQQIKESIVEMQENYNQLINYIDCVIPKPPIQCSNLKPQPSKLDWSKLIPVNQAESIFETQSSQSDDHFKSISLKFNSAIQNLNLTHNMFRDYVTCSQSNKSDCAAKTWSNIFTLNYWLNKLGLPITKPGWNILFGFQKPNSILGQFTGSLGSRPFYETFSSVNSQASQGSGGGSASGQTSFGGNSEASGGGNKPGFIFAVSGGQVSPSVIGINNNQEVSDFFISSTVKPPSQIQVGTDFNHETSGINKPFNSGENTNSGFSETGSSFGIGGSINKPGIGVQTSISSGVSTSFNQSATSEVSFGKPGVKDENRENEKQNLTNKPQLFSILNRAF